MKKSLVIFSTVLLSVCTATAQTKKAPAKKDEGYKTTPNGMEYKVIYDAPGTQKPALGDFISVHLKLVVDDSTHFSTRTVLNNQPAEIQIMAAPGKGDVIEGFMYLTTGDSAVFRYSIDSLMTLPGFQQQPWMKAGVGQMAYYYVVLAGIKSAADKQKETEAAASKQKDVDDKLLQEYFSKNNIKPTKTASGLYYSISKMGTGPVAKPGQKVSVNYTGKTMDGKTFDSNVDPAFQHVQPFEFNVGQGMVIKGWDESFGILKKGTKATLYIPSPLAYGANSPDPSRIPANGILIFDVELLDVITENNATPSPANGK